MIKFHNKVFTSVLCLLIALAACSPVTVQEEKDSGVEETQDTGTATMAAITPTPALTPAPISTDEELLNIDLPDGIELEFWHTWSGSQAEVFEDLVEEFNQTNRWGIRVVAQGHGDALVILDDMDQALEAGELPEIIAAPSQHLRLWDQQGIPVKDLNEYVESEDLGFDQETLNAFLPAFWKTDLDESGRRLGVPAYRSGNFLFYNQSWAQELGFEKYPQTILDFTEQVCAAGLANSITEKSGTGGWFYDTQSTTMYSWLRAFTGEQLVGESGNVDFTVENNQIALEMLYDWYVQNCSWTGRQSVPYEYFARRYALVYSGSSEDIFTQELIDQENYNADEWVLIPYPTDEYRPVVIISGDSYALIGEDEEKNLAGWLFLRFMLMEENQARIIEATGSLPFSNTVINLLADFREAHPAWGNAIQFITVAQTMPLLPQWIEIEPVFSDIAWQLKYTLSIENIPGILKEADAIVKEINAE